MEAVAASFDAVAAIKCGPLLGEGPTIGAEADEPPLRRMMPVHGPPRENRPGSGAVQTKNIRPVAKDLCPPSGL